MILFYPVTRAMHGPILGSAHSCLRVTISMTGSSVCRSSYVSGTTNEGKPFDATFRITDVYRKSQGKWVIVQEHISLPPDVARW